MTVGSLFSGIGGIDIGFNQAGFSVAWAIEKDAACCRTYRHNFPNINLIESDICKVETERLSTVDVIAAGFPCQPFSIAGKQLGFADIRGTLFYEVARIARDLQPRCLFLENVPNLIEHDKGRTFITIHNVLSELGYFIRYKVMRASEYGNVPQIRDRIYIVAFKDIADCDNFEYPECEKLTLTIDQIIKRDEQKQKVYYYSDDDKFAITARKIVKQKDSIYRVYHDSIKITQNRMCPTLTASMGTQKNQVHLIVDDFGLRKLTVRECLDFQGFPSSFAIPFSNTIEEAYKQCGNTVCVPVVKRIAERIKGVIENV